MASATLNEQDDLHVSAAEGWWLLGDYDSAVKELEQISAEARLNHGVQSLRHLVYAAKSGRMNSEPASLSDDPFSWTTVARATLKTGQTAEAKKI